MKTRMIKVIEVVAVLSGFLAGLSLFLAASTSDFYTIELRKAVPGNKDMILLVFSSIFLLVAWLLLHIKDQFFFSDLKELSVKYSAGICDTIKDNVQFKDQLVDAINRYYAGDWGTVKKDCISKNNNALKYGTGRIKAAYRTDYGMIKVIAARNEVKVSFKGE